MKIGCEKRFQRWKNKVFDPFLTFFEIFSRTFYAQALVLFRVKKYGAWKAYQSCKEFQKIKNLWKKWKLDATNTFKVEKPFFFLGLNVSYRIWARNRQSEVDQLQNFDSCKV